MPSINITTQIDKIKIRFSEKINWYESGLGWPYRQVTLSLRGHEAWGQVSRCYLDFPLIFYSILWKEKKRLKSISWRDPYCVKSRFSIERETLEAIGPLTEVLVPKQIRFFGNLTCGVERFEIDLGRLWWKFLVVSSDHYPILFIYFEII